MKKIIALAIAGILVLSIPVMAAETSSSAAAADSSAAASTGSVSGNSSASSEKEDAPEVTVNMEHEQAHQSVAREAQNVGKNESEYVNNGSSSAAGLKSDFIPVASDDAEVSKPSAGTVKVANQVVDTLKSAGIATVGATVIDTSVYNKQSTNGGNVTYYLKDAEPGQEFLVFGRQNGQWVVLNYTVSSNHITLEQPENGSVIIIRTK